MSNAAAPEPLSTFPVPATQPRMAGRWAWVLGFCLPLSGGLPLSRWIPGFIDQLTPIRLVTVAALAWLAVVSLRSKQLPRTPDASRNMILAMVAGCTYALITLLWTPSRSDGIHDVITLGLALATPIALLLLVQRDQAVLAAFARGVLWAGAAQVALAVIEVLTGFHVSIAFGASFLKDRGLERIEQVFGPVAVGTMGNPNDLGGLLLLVMAVFLSARAYGVELASWARRLGWILASAGIAVGFTSLNDARGFRFGVLLLAAMHLVDRWLPNAPRLLRIPTLLASAVVAFLITLLPIKAWIFAGIRALFPAQGGSGAAPLPELPPAIGESDWGRLTLISRAFQTALDSLGFGRGIGTEQAMIDAGQIPLNFHNIVAQLAAELGFVIAAAYLCFLCALLVTWAFVTNRSRSWGGKTSLAAASLAITVLLYGSTSSGVMDSPVHWAFFGATALLIGLRPQLPDRTPAKKTTPPQQA